MGPYMGQATSRNVPRSIHNPSIVGDHIGAVAVVTSWALQCPLLNAFDSQAISLVFVHPHLGS